MIYSLLASLIVIIHFVFILFVLFGGLLVFKWRWIIWLHLPAMVWGVLIEFIGWICPLTPLENWFRQRAGAVTYETGFIERYLLPLIYPANLTQNIQLVLGMIVIVVNVIIYGWLFIQIKR